MWPEGLQQQAATGCGQNAPGLGWDAERPSWQRARTESGMGRSGTPSIVTRGAEGHAIGCSLVMGILYFHDVCV